MANIARLQTYKLCKYTFQKGSCLYLAQNRYSSNKGTADDSSSKMPKNILEDFHSASKQSEMGTIYDKKPFKMVLEPEKKYFWCACGKSKSQPLCDGSHKNPHLRIKLRPVLFQIEEKKEYWLCNCKQTKHRPFCDGTHKREDIQAAIRN